MKIKTVGSGSSGNSYILKSNSGQTLLLELGVRFADIKKALSFDLSNVAGALVSHCHQDHCKGTREAVNAGIDVYCLQETIDAFKFKNHRLKAIEPLKTFTVGEFKVKPFPLEHDVPSVGFILSHEEMGNCVFITDTMLCEYTFDNMHNLILEANYCQEILDEKTASGKIHNFLRTRIMNSHMSLDTAKGFLEANDLSKLANVLVIHLSDSNSDAKRFKAELQQIAKCNVEIACKGLEMEFNKEPF